MSGGRLDALRARWHNVSLKTSFMVYMLGFLLLALVMSTVTAGMFSALQHSATEDAYEVSGLYLYDAQNEVLVPARAVDIDENGSSVFVQTVRGDVSEMPLMDLSSLVEITDASDYQYAAGTYLYGSASDEDGTLSIETPGTSGLPELPEDAELTPAERLAASVASLAAQVERLERYVQAMSGLQKLEDRAVVARPAAFDEVADMIDDAGAGLAACGDRAFALSVSVRCDRERPALCVDQSIVGEVAENLLNNAMRYASSQVDARIDVRDGALVLIVEDDGPGFTPTALERGCAPFFSEVPSAEHFGLGLNIASLMCEKHGGDLALQNREEGGARVVARFSLGLCESVDSR